MHVWQDTLLQRLYSAGPASQMLAKHCTDVTTDHKDVFQGGPLFLLCVGLHTYKPHGSLNVVRSCAAAFWRSPLSPDPCAPASPVSPPSPSVCPHLSPCPHPPPWAPRTHDGESFIRGAVSHWAYDVAATLKWRRNNVVCQVGSSQTAPGK